MAISVNVPLATNQILTDYAAMNANWEYVVLSDGTAGQVLRYSRLVVAYNATADSVQVYFADVWNGDDVDSSGTPHVITVVDVDTNWGFPTVGQLTIYAAGLTGNAVAAFAHITYNKTGESNISVDVNATASRSVEPIRIYSFFKFFNSF